MRSTIFLRAIAKIIVVPLDSSKVAINLSNSAKNAVEEVRKDYTISDYHFPIMDEIHHTGQLNTKTHNLPGKGEFVVCDELLQNKFILGYYDESRKSWFDINPILIEDLNNWKATNSP